MIPCVTGAGRVSLLRYTIMNGAADQVETILFAQHGWADDNRAMQRFGEGLALPRTRVIATKLGYIRTWMRIEPLIATAESAAEAALAEHPDSRIRVVGHSMGGLIWIELLTRHPEWLARTDRVALVGCPVGGAEIAAMLDPLGLTIGRDLKVDRRALAEAVAAAVPTLAIIGDLLGTHDGTVSHESARFKNARLVRVPAASHASSRHNPWVGRLVRAFFDDPSPPSVDRDALVTPIAAIPSIRPIEPRLLRLAQVPLMLADGTTVRTLRSIPGLVQVFVVDAEGQCVYAGQVPRASRPALDETLAEIRAQHQAILLDA
jgi:pimeloyl-ACP methyl ester carboxylesterase